MAAFVNNATDTIGTRSIQRGAEGDSYVRYGATTDPRLYGLEVRYQFGPVK